MAYHYRQPLPSSGAEDETVDIALEDQSPSQDVIGYDEVRAWR